ncbi:xanthine dehydrogenase family protein molybdopterin-binding subunit [Chloroflexota bacterium]
MTEFSVVGHNVPKLDTPGKVTGSARYTTDIKLPGMLVGKVLRSPYPHAKILSIDTSAAEGLPGVKAVVTAKDIAGTVMFPPKWQPPLTGGEVQRLAVMLFPPDWQPPLVGDRVRCVGDAVAAVAAIDGDVALEALELIKVDYEPLPAVFDAFEALKPDAPQIHQAEHNKASAYEVVRGDVDAGFEAADFIAEGRFETPPQYHCCPEPNTCIASFDASGRLTIRSCSVNIFGTRHALARFMGLPENRVRVLHSEAVGGHFGNRAEPSPEYFISALLAWKAGMPVKIENTREEEFATTKARIPTAINVRMGVKRDGTITAKETRITGNCGAYYHPITDAVLNTTALRHESLYRFSNVKTEVTLVYTNRYPSGAFRGFGNPEGHFALESMMDMLAEGIGMDPAEFRLKNVVRSGDITVHGWEIRSCGISECIKKATESANWKRKRANKQYGRGVGMSCAIHVSGRRVAGTPFSGDISNCGAFVKINDDGTVHLLTGAGDGGQGSLTVLAQICAEELGVHLEDIWIPTQDTDFVPYSAPPVSSRTTTLEGNAVRQAAADAKYQLFEIAAKELAVHIQDLESGDRKVYVRDNPKVALSVAELASHAAHRPILGKGTYTPQQPGSDPETWYGDCATAYNFIAYVAEVAVDTETGKVKVLNLTAAGDLGKAINPQSAEGQIDGGIAQGLGYALSEETVIGDNGKMLNTRYADYRLPTTSTMPVVNSILVETDEPAGPFGAKGIGEVTMVAVAPAIANAIYDAVCVRIKELPITPERLLRALKEKGES